MGGKLLLSLRNKIGKQASYVSLELSVGPNKLDHLDYNQVFYFKKILKKSLEIFKNHTKQDQSVVQTTYNSLVAY